jgi:MarR family transcriptional repressor of emrRAB
MVSELKNYAERREFLESILSTSEMLLSDAVAYAHRSVISFLERQLRACGFTHNEFQVLSALLYSHDRGGVPPSELSVETCITFSNVSRISETLVRRKLVARHAGANDRRKRFLSLTADGEDTACRLLQAISRPMEDIFKEFSPEEERQLAAQLIKLCRNMNKRVCAASGNV